MKPKVTAILVFSILALALLLVAAKSWQVSADSLVPIPPSPEPLPGEGRTLLYSPVPTPLDAASEETFPVQAAVTAINSTAIITAFADAETIQGYATANCVDALGMHAGYDTGLTPAGGIVRSLMQFHPASIRRSATVYSATLWVYLAGSYDYAGHSMAIVPYQVTSPWYAYAVNWNNSPSFGAAYTATWITHGAWGWYAFDVTPLVRGWVNGTIPNHGLALRSYEMQAGWREFAASGTIYPPRLVVAYQQSPEFVLTAVPDSVTAAPGSKVASLVYLTALGGFNSGVTMTVGGLPPFASAQWQANRVTPTATTLLTVTTSSDTPVGMYTLTFTGTAGSQVQTGTIRLQVERPDFALAVTPPSRAVIAGQSVAYTAFLTAMGGFTGGVWLDAGGLPAQASAAWGANPVTPTAQAALTITTKTETPVGVYTLRVTGTHGSATHSATAVLSVTRVLTPTVYLPIVVRNSVSQGTLLAPAKASMAALIIGVSDYEHMNPVAVARAGAPGNKLRYSGNDAVNAHSLFLAGGTFNSSNTALQLESRANKGAIHAAIVNWLDPIEDENTTIVIFFSGHGMFAPDDNADENDPYDEFIVPYEMEWDDVLDRWLYEMAIRDDELEQWLSVLESRRIVIILDSCFSGGLIAAGDGTIAAGDDQVARGLGQRPSAAEAMTAAQWRDGFVQDIQGPGRVVLAASREDQSSWEFGALKDGVFTYYMLEAMATSSADANSNGWVSAEEAFDYADGRVDSYVWANTSTHQYPQMSDGVTGQVDLVQPGAPIGSCPAW